MGARQEMPCGLKCIWQQNLEISPDPELYVFFSVSVMTKIKRGKQTQETGRTPFSLDWVKQPCGRQGLWTESRRKSIWSSKIHPLD